MSIAFQQLPLMNYVPIQIAGALHILSVLINMLYVYMLSYSFSSKYAGITSTLFLIVFHEYTEYAYRTQIYLNSSKTVKRCSRVEAVFEGENPCVLFLQPPTQLTK